MQLVLGDCPRAGSENMRESTGPQDNFDEGMLALVESANYGDRGLGSVAFTAAKYAGVRGRRARRLDACPCFYGRLCILHMHL